MPNDLSSLGDLVVQVGGDISPLQDALNQVPDAVNKAAAAVDEFFGTAPPDAVANAAAGVAEAVTAAGTAAQNAAGPMGDLSNEVQNTGRSISDLVPPLNQATDETANLVKQMAALAAALGLLEGLRTLAEDALAAYGAMQKDEIALTALTGSASTAAAQIDALKQLALQDALSFPALLTANQRMEALGISVQQIPGLLQAAANAAGAMNGDFSTTVNLLDRFVTSGVVMARSLSSLGLSTQDLANVMGVAATQVTAAFKALDQTDRITVIEQALQKFGGVAQEQAQGISGQFQNLKTTMLTVMQDLGNALAPVASEVINLIQTDVIPFLKGLVDGFAALPLPVKEFALAIGALAVALPPLIISFNLLAKAFETVGPAMWTGLGSSVLYASAAFAGWQLGAWLTNNIPLVQALRDKLHDLFSLIPGMPEFMNQLNGTSASEAELQKNTDALAAKLKAMGIEIEVGPNASVYDYRKAVMDAAAANAPLIASIEGTTTAFSMHDAMVKGVSTTYQKQQADLANAKMQLEAVKQAIADGIPAWGQLEAAQKAVDAAMVALNPHYITAADYQKMLLDSSKQLDQANTTLAQMFKSLMLPTVMDLATAQANLAKAQDDVRQKAIDVQLAEAGVTAAKQLGRAGTQQLIIAENLLAETRKLGEAAVTTLKGAEKDVAASRKDAAAETELLQQAQDAYNAALLVLNPTQKTVAQTTADLQAARAKLASDTQILLADERTYAALPKDDPARAQAAKDLDAARILVAKDTKDVTTATTALNTAQKDNLQVEQLMLSVSKDLGVLQKDGLLPATTDLTSALGGLREAQQKVLDAYAAEQTALTALKTLRADNTASAQDLKAAEDNLTLAHKNLTTAESQLHTTEQTIKEDFGLSKTAADVLAGSVVSLEAVYKDLGIKSAQSLQVLADAAMKEYQIIADSGTASAATQRDAQIKALEAEKAAMKAAGGDLDATQQATLRKLLEDQDYYNQQSIDRWYDLYKQIDSQIVTGLQDITKVFTGALFGGVDNSALKQQIAGVQQQMQDATAAWQQAQADAVTQEQKLVQANADALKKTLTDLQANLTARKDAYDQFVQAAQDKMEALKQAEADKLSASLQTLRDSLAKQQQSYDDYAKTVAQKITDLTTAEQTSIAATLDKLKASLATQTAAYDAHYQKIQTDIANVQQTEQNNIDAQTQKTKDAIQTRTDAYNAGQTAIQQKINQLEASGQTATSPQVVALQNQLAANTKAYNDYVKTQTDALNAYVKAQQDAATKAINAYQSQLDAQTKAYKAFIVQNQTDQQTAAVKAQEQLDKQVAALNASLQQRADALELAKKQELAREEEITQNDQRQLLAQENALKDSIDKQTKAYQDYQAKIKADEQIATQNAKDSLAAQEQAVKDSLAKQADAYQKTMDGYTAQINKFKDQFKTIWSELGDAVLKAAQGMLNSMVNAFLKPMEDAIAHAIASWITGILGMSSSMTDTLKPAVSAVTTGMTDLSGAAAAVQNDVTTMATDLSSAVTPALDATTSAASGLSTAASDLSGSVGDLGSGVSSLSSSLGGGNLTSALTSVMGVVTGVVSAITGVLSFIESMHQTDILKSIELNTRQTHDILRDSIWHDQEVYYPYIFDLYQITGQVLIPAIKDLRGTLENNLTAAGRTENLLNEIKADLDKMVKGVDVTGNVATGQAESLSVVKQQLLGIWADTNEIKGDIHDYLRPAIETIANASLIMAGGALGGQLGAEAALQQEQVSALETAAKAAQAQADALDKTVQALQKQVNNEADQVKQAQLKFQIDQAEANRKQQEVTQQQSVVDALQTAVQAAYGQYLQTGSPADLQAYNEQLQRLDNALNSLKEMQTIAADAQATATRDKQIAQQDQANLTTLQSQLTAQMTAAANASKAATEAQSAATAALAILAQIETELKAGGGQSTSGGGGIAGNVAQLATFISSNFSTLFTWLSAAFRPLLIPSGSLNQLNMPQLPVFSGGPAGTTSTPAAPLTIVTNFNGPVYGGQNAMQQMTRDMADTMIAQFRRAGMKF